MLNLKREKKNNWRTHCHRGHPWTPENTLMVKSKSSKGGLCRQCRTCKKNAYVLWKERVKKPKKPLVDRTKESYTSAEPSYL